MHGCRPLRHGPHLLVWAGFRVHAGGRWALLDLVGPDISNQGLPRMLLLPPACSSCPCNACGGRTGGGG